ncbi:MAG TPA: FkbM family methyltransferase [Stellaceae bacterium]|nr:FkbM family methyltransferase [Stellaceae bacterium]
MSDLFVNPHPRFGRWVLARGLLRTPFVLADIGVQGGISQRWSHLEGHLIVHGFDPLEETIEPLRRKALPGHHYHAIALGNEDGERDLHVPDISFASSFYAGVHETGLANPAGISSNARARRVPIRRLDGLVSSGEIDRPDLIKIDCEGFEPEILDGAAKLLEAAPPLAIESESTFRSSGNASGGHFFALSQRLLPHGFRVADLAFSRTPYTSFVERAHELRRRIVHRTLIPQLDVLNVVFYRDLSAKTPSTQEVLKQAIVFEAYGLRDSAFERLRKFRGIFPPEARIADGADLLTKWAGRLRHLVPIRPTRI